MRGNSAKDFETVVHSLKKKKIKKIKKRKGKEKESRVKGMNFHLATLTTLKEKVIRHWGTLCCLP